MIREVAIRYVGARRRVPEKIASPAQAARYFRRRIHDDGREHFVALYLDGRHRAIADAIVSIGTATASLVNPRKGESRRSRLAPAPCSSATTKDGGAGLRTLEVRTRLAGSSARR